jgi:hypothetical protein
MLPSGQSAQLLIDEWQKLIYSMRIAGFNQAFRSIIPESVAGLVPGSKFETWGAAFDQKFDTGTYLGVTGEILNSDADRTIGAFDYSGVPPAIPGSTRERLDYKEKSLTVTLNQLVSKEWSLGASYRITGGPMRPGPLSRLTSANV